MRSTSYLGAGVDGGRCLPWSHLHLRALSIVCGLLSVASILSGCRPAGRPSGVEGVYRWEEAAAYGRKTMKEVPPGQVRHLRLEDGHWQLSDMMLGFSGTYEQTPSGATLTILEGPTGPADKPQTLTARRTREGLSVSGFGPVDVSFRYVSAPTP